MSDLNLSFETEHKKINLDGADINDTSINVERPDNNMMLGVELLANKKNSKSETSPLGGYSSGEDGTPKQSSDNELNFFTNNDVQQPSENIHPEINEIRNEQPTKKINVPPENDPMINSIKGASSDFKSIHEMNSQDIKNEKIDLIYKFKKLENQGVRTTMNYNMNSQLEDMRNEYIKLKKQREVENSVKFQRKVMMAAITGLEFLNHKFDPFDVKLDGWSESVNDNLPDYDEVFEELAEKYGAASGNIAPELKLLMMIGGSAFMFHLTNTMFKSSIPGMDDIMKQNPELMKQFAKAAVGSIGKTQEPERMNINTPVQKPRNEMSESEGIDDLINQMNLQPNNIPDLDNISLMSGDTGKLSQNSGITLNL
tara:strand:+ start:2315 stop:3424 length:1110 start_codon:yes stop_codon:yes gene_type:complete